MKPLKPGSEIPSTDARLINTELTDILTKSGIKYASLRTPGYFGVIKFDNQQDAEKFHKLMKSGVSLSNGYSITKRQLLPSGNGVEYHFDYVKENSVQEAGGVLGLASTFAGQEKKSGKAGNVYFKGNVLYSYGEHWPLAILDVDRKIAYVNSSKYSASTSKQTSQVSGRLRMSGYETVSIDVDTAKQYAKQLPESVQEAVGHVLKDKLKKELKMFLTAPDKAYEIDDKKKQTYTIEKDGDWYKIISFSNELARVKDNEIKFGYSHGNQSTTAINFLKKTAKNMGYKIIESKVQESSVYYEGLMKVINMGLNPTVGNEKTGYEAIFNGRRKSIVVNKDGKSVMVLKGVTYNKIMKEIEKTSIHPYEAVMKYVNVQESTGVQSKFAGSNDRVGMVDGLIVTVNYGIPYVGVEDVAGNELFFAQGEGAEEILSMIGDNNTELSDFEFIINYLDSEGALNAERESNYDFENEYNDMEETYESFKARIFNSAALYEATKKDKKDVHPVVDNVIMKQLQGMSESLAPKLKKLNKMASDVKKLQSEIDVELAAQFEPLMKEIGEANSIFLTKVGAVKIKRTEGYTKSTTSYAKVLEDLRAKVDDAVKAMMDELTEAHTKMSEVAVSIKAELKEKEKKEKAGKVDEALSFKNISAKVKSAFKSIVSKLKSALKPKVSEYTKLSKKYEKLLADIKS